MAEKNYDDIINLPHHVSDYHKPMPMSKRAAQFAPFAALNGHEEAIDETIRITETFKELSEEEKNRLSRSLNLAIEYQKLVEITYFTPDKRKAGGLYKKIKARIEKWDSYENLLILEGDLKIPVTFISDVKIK